MKLCSIFRRSVELRKSIYVCIYIQIYIHIYYTTPFNDKPSGIYCLHQGIDLMHVMSSPPAPANQFVISYTYFSCVPIV